MQELFRKYSIKANIAKGILLRPITSPFLRRRLHNTDFTIIASNCIGARIYQELGIQYNTPFVGLFIYAPCYIKLLSNLESYLKSVISFVDKSKYKNIILNNKGRRYPIGLLGDGIEIHFEHYENELEAKTKWDRRIERMNLNNLFVMFTDRDFCNETLLNQFDQMWFRNKVCFTAGKYPSVKSSVWISEYQNQPYVGDMYTEFHILRRHFDFVDWLNGGKGIKDTVRDSAQHTR